MKQLDEMVAPKQVGSWSALELVDREAGLVLGVKHWKQYVWGLTALGVFIPLVAGVIGFSHSRNVGFLFLGISVFGALLAVLGNMALLDGSPVLVSPHSDAGPQFTFGRESWAGDAAIHEIYWEGRTVQKSYIIARGSSSKSLMFTINEPKPKESLVRKFCEKAQIPYYCREVKKRKELNAVYDQI